MTGACCGCFRKRRRQMSGVRLKHAARQPCNKLLSSSTESVVVLDWCLTMRHSDSIACRWRTYIVCCPSVCLSTADQLQVPEIAYVQWPQISRDSGKSQKHRSHGNRVIFTCNSSYCCTASSSSSSSSTTVGSVPFGVWHHSYYRCPPLPI